MHAFSPEKNNTPPNDPLKLFQGSGEMSALMRAYDWESHSLGNPAQWPPSLKTAIRIMLASAFPMFIWWSRDLYMFHNDPYLPALGKKHPQALGASAKDMWAEIWWQIGEIVQRILDGGEPFYAEELLIVLERKGFLEETYWTFSYSPAPDDAGGVGGIFCACSEVTKSVLTQRRVKTIKDVAAAIAQLQTVEQACQQVSQVLAQNTHDIPFSLIYLLNRQGTEAKLYGQTGNVSPEMVPRLINLVTPPETAFFPFREVLSNRQMKVLDLSLLPGNLFPDGSPFTAPKQAVVLPLLQSDQDQLLGFFLAGISPQLEYDADYQGFHELLAGQIATSIAGVQARQEVERQRARLERFFMQAPAAICILNGPDMVFELVNPGYQQLFPERELLGKPVQEALPEITNQPIWSMLRNVYQTGETFYGQEVAVRLARNPKGSLAENYFNFTYQARYDEHAQVDGIMVFAYEVTDLVEARRQVEHSEENLQLALEAGQMATFNFDFQRQQMSRSDNHDRLFGHPSNLPGWHLNTFLTYVLPEYRHSVEELFERAYQTGVLSVEAPIKRVDGQLRWLAWQGKVFFDENGLPNRITGVIVDITEPKLAEHRLQATTEELTVANEELASANAEIRETNQELTRINTDLDNFIYTASHDLKAPILNIDGLLRVLVGRLKKQDWQDETAWEIIYLMNASVSRFKETIADLTEIAKIQKQGEELTQVNIQEVIRDVELDLQQQIAEADGRIYYRLDQCQPITFSRKNLKSIIYNLLSNAIKYRSFDRKPQIVITCEDREHYLVLTVQDNGLGMDQSGQSKIFNMFKRLHSHVEGTGIGLYIVKRMIENAGGRIEVESELGLGSVFRVYFKKRR